MNSIISRVAMTLLIDYSSLYYIDLKTNHYECYSTNQGYQKLELQSSGDDFFPTAGGIFRPLYIRKTGKWYPTP